MSEVRHRALSKTGHIILLSIPSLILLVKPIYCRCLFIVSYNCINLNHDRINLNLVGAPNCWRPLVIELTLTTVRYATGLHTKHFSASSWRARTYSLT